MMSDIGEGSIAIVFIDHVLAKVVCQVEVQMSRVKEIAGTNIQCPARIIDTECRCYIREAPITIVAVEDVTATIACMLKVVMHNKCGMQMPEVNRREIIPDIQIKQPITIVIEPDSGITIAWVTST